MAQLICGGCRTLLMHPRGATSVRCACCHTVNLVPGTFFFRIKESHSLLLKFSFSSWKPSSYFSLSIFSYLAFENIYCILTSICFTFFQQDLTLRFEFPPHLPQKKNRKKEICCFRADEECLLCGRKKKHLVDVNLCRLDCGTFMKVIFVIETPKLSVWSDLFFACLKHFNFC